jgi:hypothetical protein
MLFYRAALPLSRKTLTFVAGIIRRHRISIGSCWRKLNPGQQALLVLAYLRKGETFAALAAGFGIGTTTALRYVEETVALLAARAPKLRKAVRDAKKAGYAYVIVDGTLIPIDRVAADRPFYSGKHKKHGMNLQVIASPTGGHPVGVGGTPRIGARQASRVDPVVAGGADDEGLAPYSCHEGGPRGLSRSWFPELLEAGDLVGCHRGAGLAYPDDHHRGGRGRHWTVPVSCGFGLSGWSCRSGLSRHQRRKSTPTTSMPMPNHRLMLMLLALARFADEVKKPATVSMIP